MSDSKLLDLASHFALIFDKSATGRSTMELFISRSRGEDAMTVGDRLEAKLPLWEQGDFQFIAMWWSNETGKIRTAMAVDLDQLLEAVIPNFVDLTLEFGGYCAFTLGVDTAIQQTIQDRIAQLQPVQSGRS